MSNDGIPMCPCYGRTEECDQPGGCPVPLAGGATTTTPADEGEVERAARAIWTDGLSPRDGRKPWSQIMESTRATYRQMARAALAARAVPPAQPTTGQDEWSQVLWLRIREAFWARGLTALDSDVAHVAEVVEQHISERLALVPQPTTADNE